VLSVPRADSRAGQALVEFALAAAVFMLLLLGTFDVARAYMAYTVASNAAREASRYGAAHLGESGWEAAAVQAGRNLAVGIDPAALSLSVGTTQTGSLTYITVSGTYRFQSLVPLVGAVLGNPIDMPLETSALAG
jgi:Flp pilus assembly protein TadG